MCDDAAADAAALLIIYTCFDIEHKKQEKKKIEKKRKRKWSEEWLLERKKHSHVATLKNMEMLTPRDYKNFLRMDVDTYEELLRWVTPAIKKEDTVMRDAITPNERLSATLRFLASGQSYEDLKFLTKISAQSLGGIILETSKAIIAALKPFIKVSENVNIKFWLQFILFFYKYFIFRCHATLMNGKQLPMTSKIDGILTTAWEPSTESM